MRTLKCFILILPFLLLYPSISTCTSLFIKCDVSEATVIIDSHEKGKTNEKGEAFFDDVSPGRHTVSLSKEGYVTHTETITTKENLTNFLAQPSTSP